MKVEGVHRRTVVPDGPVVHLVDQPALPWAFRVVSLPHHQATAAAIRDMVVRGAGAIGATAAGGMAQAALEAPDRGFWDHVHEAAATLRATRPTAQNLFYAVDHVLTAMRLPEDRPSLCREAAVSAARALADDDAACCEAIGQHGLPLLRDGMRVATHCNAGWLAFVDWGSALAPIYAGHRAGLGLHVWVDETRPRGQGARLTAWELGQEGVPHAVITDGVVGHLLQRGQVDAVIVGSDRITANGDVVNKIGTYLVALAAREASVPFYVAAPTTTIDAGCPSGAEVPIETRSAREVEVVEGPDEAGVLRRVRVLAPGSAGHNPAFDVTPAALVTGILTEAGLVPATPEGVARVARG